MEERREEGGENECMEEREGERERVTRQKKTIKRKQLESEEDRE